MDKSVRPCALIYGSRFVRAFNAKYHRDPNLWLFDIDCDDFIRLELEDARNHPDEFGDEYLMFCSVAQEIIEMCPQYITTNVAIIEF